MVGRERETMIPPHRAPFCTLTQRSLDQAFLVGGSRLGTSATVPETASGADPPIETTLSSSPHIGTSRHVMLCPCLRMHSMTQMQRPTLWEVLAASITDVDVGSRHKPDPGIIRSGGDERGKWRAALVPGWTCVPYEVLVSFSGRFRRRQSVRNTSWPRVALFVPGP